jgi:hypothetical protein
MQSSKAILSEQLANQQESPYNLLLRDLRSRFSLGHLFRSGEAAEHFAIRFALVIYLLFQINAAFHHGSWGQDFESQKAWTSHAFADPWHFLIAAEATRPEPPLYHLLAALVVKITGGVHYLEVIALLSIAINTVALVVYYKLLRLLLNDRLIRIAGFLFLAFLPVFMIHAIVLATDALCVPTAVVTYYLLIRVSREQDSRKIKRYLVGITCTLLIGMANKFLFVSQGVAVLIALAIFVWTHRLRRADVIKGFVAVLLLTIAETTMILRVKASLAFNTTAGTEMAPRDILLLHRPDIHILNAPPYNRAADPRDGTPVTFPYELLRFHRYSYAALVHLGIFTDILNIYQYDPTDSYFGARSQTNQKRMQVAVKTGLLFSVSGLILTALIIFKSFYGSIVRRRSEDAEQAALATCGLGWFLNIVVFLPAVPAYPGGFWPPRLILPALLCFTVLSAVAIERLLARRPRTWAKAILATVILQSLLQLSFLWPWGILQGQTVEGYPKTHNPS